MSNHFYHFRCDFDDTAQYRASAMNVKGEISAYASLVVKSRFAKNLLWFFCFFVLFCFKMHVTNFIFVVQRAFTSW